MVQLSDFRFECSEENCAFKTNSVEAKLDHARTLKHSVKENYEDTSGWE